MPVPLTAIPNAIPLTLENVISGPNELTTDLDTPELPAYVSFALVLFIAEQSAASRLHPELDNVHPFTSVFSGRNLRVPDTALEFATESTTTDVAVLTLETLAPVASPVPTAVIPAAMPVVLPTVMLVDPDDPVAVVEIEVAPPKDTVPFTAPELAADSVTSMFVTVAPAATPPPVTVIPATIPATLDTTILETPNDPLAVALIVDTPSVKVTGSEKVELLAAERFTVKGVPTIAPTPIPLP